MMILGFTDIGIDLGTANVLVYVRGRGIVIQEPSVVAVTLDPLRVVAVGEEAKRMLGRAPKSIEVKRPMRDGVIADVEITELMLTHLITRVTGRRPFFRPRVVVCIPSGLTGVEKRAVKDAVMEAGAGTCELVEQPVAAAIGAGLDISLPSGSMVVDIGGGTTDIAVLALKGVVVAHSLRVGGDKCDEAIQRYIRKMYNLMIGESTAELVKLTIGTAYPEGDEQAMEIKGRDLVTGLPRTITITSRETYEALSEPISAMQDGIRSVLEKTPPELAKDILEKGMVLTGGGALLRGLPRLLSESLNIPVHVADDPMTCVARGAGKMLEEGRGRVPRELVVSAK